MEMEHLRHTNFGKEIVLSADLCYNRIIAQESILYVPNTVGYGIRPYGFPRCIRCFRHCNTKVKPAIKSRKECTILGYIKLFVGFVLVLSEIYLIFISVGFRKKHCKRCKGYLVNTIQRKNCYIGPFSRFYKHYIEYDYEYRVNGKEYHTSGSGPGVKSNLRQVVDIVYQKNNPKLAYIHRLTFPMQPIIAIILFPLCIIVVMCEIF